MKILQICAYAAPYGGNFIKSLIALASEAKIDNVETIFCFPERNRKIQWCKDLESSYKIYYVPLAHARFLPKTYIMLKRIFRENPDIAYAHSHFELYDTPLSLMAPKGVKVFWHLHDAIGTYLHGIHKLIWKLHYSLFSKRAILLSVSEKHLSIAVKLGFNPQNAYYEPNAIDTERVQKIATVRKTTSDFLIFGWDYYRKGVDIAEHAVSKLGNGTILGIIGLRQEKIIKCEGYTIKEMKSSADINKVLASTKCFLHISRAEGLSYALLEALYSGLPVIVSDIEENQVAKDFPTAIMVHNEDVDGIVEVMDQLQKGIIKITDDAICKSRKMIQESFSIQSWAKRIYEDYKTLNPL